MWWHPNRLQGHLLMPGLSYECRGSREDLSCLSRSSSPLRSTSSRNKPSVDVECDSDFENDYNVYNKLNIIYKQASNLQEEVESYIIESEESSDSVIAS